MSVVGIDEVGRGCWAGPLVAGAVVLTSQIPGLKDSKLLSRFQRQALDHIIKNSASAYSLGWASPREIDKLGLTKATSLAMQRALNSISFPYDEVIIDGKYNFLIDNPKSRTLIKADSLIPSVSAASIIAKVARDNFMTKLALNYPKYGFESHVGYGTQMHRENLSKYGLTKIHRYSYKPVKAFMEPNL